MRNIYRRLLLILATATNKELARHVRYLQVENRILRDKLPARIALTPQERNRLIRFGAELGKAFNELVTIVHPNTLRRWIRESRGAKKLRSKGRPKIRVDIRRLVLKLARENGWGLTRILGELKKLGVGVICRSTVRNILRENGYDPGPKRGVLSDQVVRLGKSAKAAVRPDHPIRLICVKCTPHTTRGKSRSGSCGVDSDGILRIATNLLDVPAEMISLIYSERWAIEIFFRFFKQILGCRHFISHSQDGIEIQTYCAIIACLLISLWTGRKPTLRTYEMICYYFCGMASEEELMRHIAKLKAQDEATRKI